jgi:hypothetical protein
MVISPMPKPAGTVMQARSRAWLNWNNDGLSALIQGFALSLLGASQIWHNHEHSLKSPELLQLVAILILLDQIVTRKIVGWLKTFISFPRTGYVALPPFKELLATSSSKRSLVWTLIWTAISIGVSSYLLFTHLQWYLIVIQITLAALLWVLCRKRKLAWYVPIPLLIGSVSLSLLPSSNRDKMEILVIQIGALLMLMGLSRLLQYLHEHPVPQA